MIGIAFAALVAMQIFPDTALRQPSMADDPYVMHSVVFHDYPHPKPGPDIWITIPAKVLSNGGWVERSFKFHYTDISQPLPSSETPPWNNVIYHKVVNADGTPELIMDNFVGFVRDGDRLAGIPFSLKTLEAVKVVAYGPAPAGSGIIHTRRRIAVAADDVPLDIYVTWGIEGQSLPPIGATCDIKWYWDWIEGWGHRDDGKELRPDRVMTNFSCHS